MEHWRERDPRKSKSSPEKRDQKQVQRISKADQVAKSEIKEKVKTKLTQKIDTSNKGTEIRGVNPTAGNRIENKKIKNKLTWESPTGPPAGGDWGGDGSKEGGPKSAAGNNNSEIKTKKQQVLAVTESKEAERKGGEVTGKVIDK